MVELEEMNRAAMGVYNDQAKMQCRMDDKGEKMLTAVRSVEAKL